ncbi:hypothetical protein RUM43_006169 [Polyplax serrata]|uniref:PX domain-containing protein n=1 Tax=Polyplax serrata TaxID=468196 RepID=A0AAN8S3D1_POLSC
MACFFRNGDRLKISIPRVEERDKCTFYEIQVESDTVKWSVFHRFKDFVQLHEVLVSGHSVAKDLLPPKKVIGNKEPSFIEKRRSGLEIYLTTVVRFLQKTMPKELASFLDFQYYDIIFLLNNLAEEFFIQDDTIQLKSHVFTPLELHAVSERLKQPCPTFGQIDQRQDFSHVLDYCLQLSELNVQGSNSSLRNSDIIPNQLSYELTPFKLLNKLVLDEVNCKMIRDLGDLRSTLKTLEIHNSKLSTLSELLLCDQTYKEEVDVNGPNVFTKVTHADFSNNQIRAIDKSIQLLPNVEVLNFENNQIEDLEYLNSLIKLKYLNLSGNCFKSTQNLEIKLCKIVYLDLSQNQLTSLKEFSKLYSLETLDVRSNKICDVDEVRHISHLPCLENLILTGNSVSVIVDYRIKVLELFGNRAAEICLDNEKSNQKELDKVAILQAIRLSKENRMTPIK